MKGFLGGLVSLYMAVWCAGLFIGGAIYMEDKKCFIEYPNRLSNIFNPSVNIGCTAAEWLFEEIE